MTHRGIIRWGGMLAAVGGLVFATTLVAEDEKPKGAVEERPLELATPTEAAPDPEAIESPVTEENVTAFDGTPEEMMKYVDEAGLRIRRSRLSREDAIRYQVFLMLKTSDKMAAHEKATDEERDLARQMKTVALHRGSQMELEGFGDRFSAFVAELKKDHPKSEATANASAYLLAGELFKEPKPVEGAQEKIDAFAKEYPDSMLGIQLYASLGQQLEMSGEAKQAIAIYRKALEAYPDSPFGERIQESLSRLEMIGKPVVLSGPKLDGQTFNIDSLKGKVVLVDVWATWCGPCVADMPSMMALYDKYHAKGFEIVGVSVDENKGDLESFVADKKIPWTQVFYGADNVFAKQYRITGVPTKMLIDKQGKLQSMTSGQGGEEELAKQVEKLLAQTDEEVAKGY